MMGSFLLPIFKQKLYVAKIPAWLVPGFFDEVLFYC